MKADYKLKAEMLKATYKELRKKGEFKNKKVIIRMQDLNRIAKTGKPGKLGSKINRQLKYYSYERKGKKLVFGYKTLVKQNGKVIKQPLT